MAICCCISSAGCHPPSQKTLVVTNARIWTADPANPQASALVARDGKFQYVGSDAEAIRIGGSARILDAGGARIIPGLIDAHIHLISGGLQLSRLNLRDAPDRAAFVEAVAARARLTPAGNWILGGRWSTESWADPSQPTKEWIDGVTPHHPVLLSRMDGHGALVNSTALILAGITADGPPDPPGGKIERDPRTREPTGILKDTAIDLVERLVPEPSAPQLDEALQRAIQHAHSHGLTGVHTMSQWSDLAVLERARQSGRLKLRVRMYVMEDDWTAFLDRARSHRGDDWLRICGFKGYMDGSLGSRSAYMAEPFTDQPGNRGLPRYSDSDRLSAMCKTALDAGLAPAFHAIGDQANHQILDAYESATRASRSAIQNPRVEHAQHLLPADIARFATLGVIASMQPYHKADDGRYAEAAIGPERCGTSYAFRSLLDAGANLAFGSDWPVVSLNPFLGIHAAVTGTTLDGRTFVPQQNITVEDALRAYTTGAAYAAGDQDRLGMIKSGQMADFVILETDPFRMPPDRLGELEVRQTFVAGESVFARNPVARE